MVGKKHRKLPKIKTWQLALILIPLGFIAATLLRFDHMRMIELKNAVIAADEVGDQEEIKDSLNALKDFVETHNVINIDEKNGNFVLYFGSGELYLAKSYERAATAVKVQAQEEAGIYANPNGNIYAQAMSVCQPLAHQYGWDWNTPDYIACYQTELAKYPAEERIENEITVALPATALYRYDFLSPVVSFTPSGVVVILTIVLLAVVVVKFFVWVALRIALAIKQKR